MIVMLIGCDSNHGTRYTLIGFGRTLNRSRPRPGSPCSIALTTGYVDSAPGSLKGVQINVEDAEQAHTFVCDHGVDVSDIETFPSGRFCFFADPDGNGWSVHEVPAGR